MNFLNLKEIKVGMLIKTAVPDRIFDKQFGDTKWFWSSSDKIMIVLGEPIKDPSDFYFSIKILYDGKIGYIASYGSQGGTHLLYEI